MTSPYATEVVKNYGSNSLKSDKNQLPLQGCVPVKITTIEGDNGLAYALPKDSEMVRLVDGTTPGPYTVTVDCTDVNYIGRRYIITKDSANLIIVEFNGLDTPLNAAGHTDVQLLAAEDRGGFEVYFSFVKTAAIDPVTGFNIVQPVPVLIGIAAPYTATA